MDPIKIIEKYYRKDTYLYNILITHSNLVKNKAIEIALKNKNLNPDIEFIKEASMLHDIGVFLTDAKRIGCFGKSPYICHGILGRKLLEKEDLPKHALVCENHVGVGITKEEIIKRNLPLPKRDMLPSTIEEKIICLADKFFSKKGGDIRREKKIEEIRRGISRYGEENLKRLEELRSKFKE